MDGMLIAMLLRSSLKIKIYIILCCYVYWHDMDSEWAFNLPSLGTQLADSDNATGHKTLSS